MKTIAYTRGGSIIGPGKHLLECCICHETDRTKLVVEDLGISAGMSGDDYSFCKKCWDSKNLGEKIMHLLGYGKGSVMKYKDEILIIEEVK